MTKPIAFPVAWGALLSVARGQEATYDRYAATVWAKLPTRGTRQMAQVFDGGVEPEGLEDEQPHRLDRPEFAFPPLVARRPAGDPDRFLGKMFRKIPLDAFERA